MLEYNLYILLIGLVHIKRFNTAFYTRLYKTFLQSYRATLRMPSLKYGAGNEEIQWPWTQNKSQRTGAQIQPNQLIKGCANYMFEKVLPSPLKNYRSKFMSLSILKHMQGCVAHICFFMFTTVVIVFQSIHWNNKNHKQRIHSTIHHLTSTDSGQEPNPASWAKWTWKEAQRFL